MDKSRLRANADERIFLVLEFTHSPHKTAGYVGVMASIPGRESTLNKKWPAYAGVVSASQLVDLQAAVASLLDEAVVAWAGVQGVLPRA